MTGKNFLILSLAIIIFSCTKNEGSESNTYLVSADKMITIATTNWPVTEPQLKSKRGYQNTRITDSRAAYLKVIVQLPAVDDSNRAVKGRILLNITPDDRISHAAFDTEPLARTVAYAMMLNYHNETLNTLTGITGLTGQVVDAGRGSNPTADVVISKLTSGQEADQLAISYRLARGVSTIACLRQTDGRYLVSYRAG
jgi:hypothetical protein